MNKESRKFNGDDFSEREGKWSEGVSEFDVDNPENNKNANSVQDAELSTGQIVKNLRALIDFEGIARQNDPNGLLGAIKAGAGVERHIKVIQEEISENEVKLGELEISLSEADEAGAEVEKEIQHKISKRKKSFLYKTKEFLGIRDNKTLKLYEKRDKNRDETLNRYHETYHEMSTLERKSRQLKEKLNELDPEQPKEDFLKAFETPLSRKEKRENLKFDALAQLSTDEYLTLWKRLNANYVTRVIEGDSPSSIGAKMVGFGREERENGLKVVKQELGNRSLRAVVAEHSHEVVVHKPIFVVFPTDVITSQLSVSTHEKNEQKDGVLLPDEIVLPSKRKEMPVDAGVLFIPKKDKDKNWQHYEEYFEKNPDKKPAHVVYYEGKPVDSVNDLLKGQGIIK